jgi:hypothetical protein
MERREIIAQLRSKALDCREQAEESADWETLDMDLCEDLTDLARLLEAAADALEHGDA